MSNAEHKYQAEQCPRCGTDFICKPNNVGSCKCMQVELSTEEYNYINARYQDCLCNNCLNELKYEHYLKYHHNKPYPYGSPD